jgi:alpha,alpha-trehalose phosphorylase
VNNNAYTNLMARENLRFASEIISWLRQTDLAVYQAMADRISLQEDEPANWAKAAENMLIPYDESRGIIPQDDAFLSKQPWDFAGTPRENYPLLLHYHPLVVMRYQVCKQADTVLAEFLLNDLFDRAQKQRDYAYYEPLTTHDSSLSGAIWGIMLLSWAMLKRLSYFCRDSHPGPGKQVWQHCWYSCRQHGERQGIVFGLPHAPDGYLLSKIPAQRMLTL